MVKILQICLDFRQIIKKYFLEKHSTGSSDLKTGAANDDDDDDLDFDLNDTPSKDRDEEDDVFGMGLLKVNSPYFLDRLEECEAHFKRVKEYFKNIMAEIMANLAKYSKKGIYSYLGEAFIRFNFNSYYVSRDREGLSD